MKFFTVLLLSVLLFSNMSNSRSFRINQIPNGTIKRCINCHKGVLGGDARNPFGKEVENNFLQNDNVVWNAELAGIDSDGDGFTNGEELQDPLGTWKSGDPAPGDPDNISNPGDPASIPKVTFVENNLSKRGFLLNSIYPNPANNFSKISLTLEKEGNIDIELYDLKGKFVKKLYNGQYGTGMHTILLHIDGNIQSGNYFLNIRFNGYSWIEMLNVIR